MCVAEKKACHFHRSMCLSLLGFLHNPENVAHRHSAWGIELGRVGTLSRLLSSFSWGAMLTCGSM